jgi:peptide/nickel transport system substrate-binding protein
MPKVLSKKERFLILLLVLIAIGSFIALPISAYYHFTKPAPDYGGSLTEGLIGLPKYINPLLAQNNDVDQDLTNLVYEGLMKYDSQGNLTYGLAQSYQISDDGLTYTFKLRDGLTWQDGQLLTADDIIFTISTAQNADYGSFQRIIWQGVDISKLNDQTVVFKLKNKYAQFLSNTVLGILPKHKWQDVKAANFTLSETNTKPIGAGPYKFSKIRLDQAGNIQSYELVPFEKYHAGKPYISQLIFKFYSSEDNLIKAYNNNEVESLGSISAQKLNSIRFINQLNIKKLKLPRYFAIFFNQSQNKLLADKNVRLALSYATDKKAILNDILANNGEAVDSPLLPGIIDIPDSVAKYDYDPSKAHQILADAGWNLPVGEKVLQKTPSPTPQPKKKSSASTTPQVTPAPTKLEIQLTTSNWPELVSVANELKKQWAMVGIQLDLNVLNTPELQQAIKDRSYEIFLFGEVLALDPDPFSFWHSSQIRDPGLNLALYNNKNADKLLEDARQTLDHSARLSKYDDFQDLIANDIPAIFLYSPYYLYAQPYKVKNDQVQLISVPSDRFDTINQWYINTKRVWK